MAVTGFFYLEVWMPRLKLGDSPRRTFRSAPDTERIIEELTERHGASPSAVVRAGLRELARLEEAQTDPLVEVRTDA